MVSKNTVVPYYLFCGGSLYINTVLYAKLLIGMWKGLECFLDIHKYNLQAIVCVLQRKQICSHCITMNG